MRVYIGLGNPGRKYKETRHNIGFMVLDRLAALNKTNFKTEQKFEAEVAEFFINQEKIILVKPLTYMNLSGVSVLKITNYYGVENDEIVVIYDDMDLPLGKLRLREKGSAGGHKGMLDITKALQTRNIPRMRIGIGSPTFEGRKDFVLGKFKTDEMLTMMKTIDKAVKALIYFVDYNFVKTMSEFNENNQ